MLILLINEVISGYSGLSILATFDVSTLILVNDTIVFNYPVLNTGGHYDSTTGIYTAPIDGTYEFIFHILSFNDNNIVAYLVVDGTDVSTRHELKYDQFNVKLKFNVRGDQRGGSQANSKNTKIRISLKILS